MVVGVGVGVVVVVVVVVGVEVGAGEGVVNNSTSRRRTKRNRNTAAAAATTAGASAIASQAVLVVVATGCTLLVAYPCVLVQLALLPLDIMELQISNVCPQNGDTPPANQGLVSCNEFLLEALPGTL